MRRLVLLALVTCTAGLAACRGCTAPPPFGPSPGEWFAPCRDGNECDEGLACLDAGAVDRSGLDCIAGTMCSVRCLTDAECIQRSDDSGAFCAAADRVCQPGRLYGCHRAR
jgi:hypothetical protein